jgi:DNA-binding MarR family transcriptional regulator
MAARQPSTATLGQELRETLSRVARRMRAEPGPPISQLVVLGRLRREGPASISDLAAAERMRPQSMAQTVRDLEAADLVSRRPDPADGRRVFIELTAAGVQRLETTVAAREDWLAETLEAELDAEERELLRRALKLLVRIADT